MREGEERGRGSPTSFKLASSSRQQPAALATRVQRSSLEPSLSLESPLLAALLPSAGSSDERSRERRRLLRVRCCGGNSWRGEWAEEAESWLL